MSDHATAEFQPQSNPSPPTKSVCSEFVADDDGRLIFYPDGPASRGFVLSDAERERSLRAAVQNLENSNVYFVGLGMFLIFPALGGFYVLAASHLLFAYLALISPLVLLGLIGFATRRHLFRPLVRDLPRVGPRDYVARRLRWKIFAVFLAFPMVSLIAEYFYGVRLAFLPRADPSIPFYADVVVPICVSYWFACLLIFSCRSQRIAQFGEARVVLGRAVSGLGAFVGCVWTISLFVHPVPQLTLTPTELVCGNLAKPKWHVGWRDVKVLDIGWGGRGKRNLVVTGDDKRTGPLQLPARLVCEISGLTVDYEKVYESVERAWRKGLDPRS